MILVINYSCIFCRFRCYVCSPQSCWDLFLCKFHLLSSSSMCPPFLNFLSDLNTQHRDKQSFGYEVSSILNVFAEVLPNSTQQLITLHYIFVQFSFFFSGMETIDNFNNSMTRYKNYVNQNFQFFRATYFISNQSNSLSLLNAYLSRC